MKIGISENIVLTADTLDTGNGEEEQMDIIISEGQTTITIPDITNRAFPQTLQTLRQYVNREVKKVLTERIVAKLKEVKNRDIRILVGEAMRSPPVIITYPVPPQTDADWLSYARQNVDASFKVIVSDRPGLNSQMMNFGQERVFQSTAPMWIGMDTTFYQNNSDTLTCAYEYLIHFSQNRKNNCKKNGQSVEAINLSVDFKHPRTGKRQHALEELFENWKIRNYERMCGSIHDEEIHPLPDYIGVGDLFDEEEDPFKLEVIDLKNWKWSKPDKERSLSVMDILRWCISAGVGVSVWDFNRTDYLQYDPRDFYDLGLTKAKKGWIPWIYIQVANNHAYFTDGTNAKKSKGKCKNLFTERMSQPPEPKEKQKQEELPNIHHEGKATHEQMIEWANDEKHSHLYHTGKDCLNALVHTLHKDAKITPDSIRGENFNSITFAKYGHLRLVPTSGKFIRDHTSATRQLFEKYPYVFGDKHTPTNTKIADEIYKNVYPDEPILGKMNQQIKKVFYACEIKADVRVKSDCYEMLSSFDLNSAYTTAIRLNKGKYQVYDVITQIEKYKEGTFNPDWFYLAENLYDDAYPCINSDKGKLILYHGSLLKYCLDKVEVKYQIRPAKELEPDHFEPFVKACDEFCSDYNKAFNWEGAKNIYPKHLINNFVGNLKRKDGVKGYSLYLNEDPASVHKHFLSHGLMPTKLDKQSDDNLYLVAYAKRLFNLENAQPIRQQIMSKCSAMLYEVYLHYEVCLKKVLPSGEPMLGATNTDAIKVRQPYENDADLDTLNEWYEQYGFWEYSKKVDEECPNYRKNKKFEEEVVKSFNETHDFEIKTENQIRCSHLPKSNKPQLAFSGIPNLWREEYDITHKWNRDIGGKQMLRLAYKNKGAWFEGLGGRGKSELIKVMTEDCEKNARMYKFIRAVCRYLSPDKGKEIREKWLERHPISFMKLAPTNKSANNIGGKTLHKGLGIMGQKDSEEVADDEEVEKDLKADRQSFLDRVLKRIQGDPNKGVPPLGVLALDEISMVGAEFWGYISHIRLRMPNLIILLFGDIKHQLPPVNEEKRNFYDAFAIKDIANFMKINLHYNFRTGTDTDDLWKQAGDPEQFKTSKKSLPDRNLCWTNKKRKEVIAYKQNKLVNPVVIELNDDENERRQTLKYVVGTPIIAEISFGKKEDRVAKNEVFRVAYLEPLVLERMDGSKPTGRYFNTNQQTLIKNFVSGYCITIHKSQGETYDDNYCIHEWKRLSKGQGVSRKLRYTAISRSTDPENKISFRA